MSFPMQPQTPSRDTGGVSAKFIFSSRMDGYRMPKPQHVDENL